MASFLDEWIGGLRRSTTLVGWAVASIVTVLSGPFGTFHAMAFPARLVYWPAVIAVTLATGSAIRILVERVPALRGFWPGGAVIAVLHALLMTGPLRAMTALALDPAGTVPVPGRTELALYVALATLGVVALRHATRSAALADMPQPAGPAFAHAAGAGAATAAAEAGDSDAGGHDAAGRATEPASPRLLNRLPARLRGAGLIRISSRGHYVDVLTDAGAADLLMRLADAIAETDGIDGLQVHRSHWVASGAVVEARRAGGRLVLVLVDGSEVPVSGTYLEAVIARGLAPPPPPSPVPGPPAPGPPASG